MKRKSIILVLALLIFGSGAQAQYNWHVTHPQNDSNLVYSFTSIGSSGNVCTAVGNKWAHDKLGERAMFYRSEDGGQTWVEQDPGLRMRRGNIDYLYGLQQVDSLTTYAIGDSGLVVCTFDGGKTWNRRDCNDSGYRMKDIHFSDRNNGISISAGYVTQLRTTTNGGLSWNDCPFQTIECSQCHAYGNGKFRLFTYGYGVIYSTEDNFAHLDSTKPIFYDKPDSIRSRYNTTNCNFTGGDTLLAYGNYFRPEGYQSGLIIRSTNAGVTWENETIDISSNWIGSSTPLDRDTVIAMGESFSYYTMSTDNGKSWTYKKLLIDSANLAPEHVFGICLTSDGTPVIAYGTSDLVGGWGALARATRITARVENYERIVWNTSLYPNPAWKELNVVSVDGLKPVYIYDMLGREVLRGKLSAQGEATFDVSKLPYGAYNVVIEHASGIMLSVGRVVLAGR